MRYLSILLLLVASLAEAQSCGGAGQPACARHSVFLGATGEDYVSTSPYVFGNRVPDWHLRVTGLRAAPVSAVVMAIDTSGHETFQWVTKGDGVSWAAWMIATGAQVDLWIEPHLAVNRFDVAASYADGSTELVAGIFAVVFPPEPVPPPVPPGTTSPNPVVIEIGVPPCALENPPCFTVDVKLVPIAP